MNDLRVVFDTNVIVSAVAWPQSVPRQSVDIAGERGRLLISEAVLEEINEVLQRPRILKYISAQRRIEFMVALVEQSELVESVPELRQCRDPKDDKFLALAVAGQATHIVSGDRDLLSLTEFERIPILRPSEFLAVLEHYPS
jgi:putative PIN family toxin of toxin-antitoxin system